MTIQVERVMHVESHPVNPSHADMASAQDNKMSQTAGVITSADVTPHQTHPDHHQAVQSTKPMQPPTGPRNKGHRSHHQSAPRHYKGFKTGVPSTETLFIGHLPPAADDVQLNALSGQLTTYLSQICQVERVRVHYGRQHVDYTTASPIAFATLSPGQDIQEVAKRVRRVPFFGITLRAEPSRGLHRLTLDVVLPSLRLDVLRMHMPFFLHPEQFPLLFKATNMAHDVDWRLIREICTAYGPNRVHQRHVHVTPSHQVLTFDVDFECHGHLTEAFSQLNKAACETGIYATAKHIDPSHMVVHGQHVVPPPTPAVVSPPSLLESPENNSFGSTHNSFNPFYNPNAKAAKDASPPLTDSMDSTGSVPVEPPMVQHVGPYLPHHHAPPPFHGAPPHLGAYPYGVYPVVPFYGPSPPMPGMPVIDVMTHDGHWICVHAPSALQPMPSPMEQPAYVGDAYPAPLASPYGYPTPPFHGHPCPPPTGQPHWMARTMPSYGMPNGYAPYPGMMPVPAPPSPFPGHFSPLPPPMWMNPMPPSPAMATAMGYGYPHPPQHHFIPPHGHPNQEPYIQVEPLPSPIEPSFEQPSVEGQENESSELYLSGFATTGSSDTDGQSAEEVIAVEAITKAVNEDDKVVE